MRSLLPLPLLVCLGSAVVAADRTALPHPKIVLGHVLSADGKWLATAGRDHAVRVWDVAGRKVRSQQHFEWIGRPLRFHGDGDKQTLSIREFRMVNRANSAEGPFAVADRLTVVDVATGKAAAKSFGGRTEFDIEAISPDGRWLIAPGPGRTEKYSDPILGLRHIRGALEVWDVATGKKQRVLDQSEDSRQTVFSHDGKRFVVVLEFLTGRSIRPVSRVGMWDAESWANAAAAQKPTVPFEFLNGESQDEGIRVVRSLAFSRNDNWLAVGGVSRGHPEEAPDIATFLDLKTGRRLLSKKQSGCFRGRISEVIFSDDSRYLVASVSSGFNAVDTGHCRKLVVWHTANGEQVLNTGDFGVVSPCISPDGKYLAALVLTKVPAVKVWNLATKEIVKEYRAAGLGEYFDFGSHPAYGFQFGPPYDRVLSFTPDGRQLIVTAPLLRDDSSDQPDFASVIDVGSWEAK